jgi:hypothetical protein
LDADAKRADERGQGIKIWAKHFCVIKSKANVPESVMYGYWSRRL